jgi:hypothetical protein
MGDDNITFFNAIEKLWQVVLDGCLGHAECETAVDSRPHGNRRASGWDQYSIQGLNCEDAERKDLLMDIGTEELSHLEVVGTLARLHLAATKFDREAAEADPLIAIARGGGVNLFNSQGNPWTADYLKNH